MKAITTKTHGLIDYITGALVTALPNLLPCRAPAARIFRMAGAGAGVYSAMTDYERGVVGIIPMETHLALDAASGAALLTASIMLRSEEPEVRAVMGCVGLFELAAAAMTSPVVGQRQSQPAAQRLVEHFARA